MVTPADGGFSDCRDSGESVTSLDRICALRGRCSVGVGGVRVVAGAGIAVLGGVFGMGLASSERGLLSVRSVRIGAGRGGTSSGAACARFDERLLRRLDPNRPRPLLLLPDLVDEVSTSSLVPFLSEPKAPLNRRPGDVLRFLPFGSVGTSNAIPDVARRDILSLGFESDPVALGPLTADSASALEPSVFPASTDLVLNNGEDEV